MSTQTSQRIRREVVLKKVTMTYFCLLVFLFFTEKKEKGIEIEMSGKEDIHLQSLYGMRGIGEGSEGTGFHEGKVKSSV